jgi:hypothetical protein
VNPTVVVVLRNRDRVESEPMEAEATLLELARIHAEVESGRTNKFLKLGTNAIFNAEDVDRLLVHDPDE